MPFALIPFALLVVPVIEIAAFIAIGGQIGIGATLLMILVTAIAGTLLLRQQGIALLTRMRGELDAGRLPAKEVGHGALLVVAGILLLTPGFVTDGLGFLLFLPPVRSAILVFIASRVQVVGPGGIGFPPGRREPPRDHPEGVGPVVDLEESEYDRRDDRQESERGSGPNGARSSPWRDPSETRD